MAHVRAEGRREESRLLEPASVYAETACRIIEQIERTQSDGIRQAVRRCASVIGKGGLVHLFGSGHSRIAVEEMFPRYGSFPGFHPIVELSLSNYHQVVGANGLQQAMYIENIEEMGRIIMGNFRFDPTLDVMIVVSSGGTNAVPVEVALEAGRLDLFTIGVTSLDHSRLSTSRHSSRKCLYEVVDLVIDTCTPPGDAGVVIEGLDTPVGPFSTIASVTVMNMIKVGVAQQLTDDGHPPFVMTSSVIVGEERSRELFARCFEVFRDLTRRL